MAVMMLEPSLDVLLRARSLSKEDLRAVCPSEEVCNTLALKLTRWKELCPFIGLNESDEEEIDEDNRKFKQKKLGIVHPGGKMVLC